MVYLKRKKDNFCFYLLYLRFSYLSKKKIAKTLKKSLTFFHSELRKNKRLMKVPKGTSDYQATWIIDEDGENEDLDEESSSDDDDDIDMMDEAMDGDDENFSQVRLHVMGLFPSQGNFVGALVVKW